MGKGEGRVDREGAGHFDHAGYWYKYNQLITHTHVLHPFQLLRNGCVLRVHSFGTILAILIPV